MSAARSADVDRGPSRSILDPGSGDPRTRGDPPVVALKCHAKPVIVDPQIAVATAHDRLRHDLLHLLRHDSHIGSATAVVGEAIEAQAAVEPSEKGDVVFEPDVGPPSATSSEASAASSEASASRAGTASPEAASRATSAAKARAAARGVTVGHSTGLHVAKRTIATGPTSATADPTTRSVADVGTVSRRGATTEIGPVSKPAASQIGAAAAIADIGALAAKIGPPAAAGPQYLLTAAAAKIHPRLTAGPDVVVAESLLHIRIVIGNAAPVRRIVLPTIHPRIVDAHGAIDVDVVPAPIDAATPIVASGRPASHRIGGPEGKAGRNRGAGDVAGGVK